MITGGVSQDLGGISLGTSGLIFIYDGAIGGSGASKALYDRFEKALERSMYIVKECPCENESGCPRCTFSYRCGNNNEYLHKYSALEILERISNGEKTELIDPTEGDRPLV
jgi:DEAD/DEAH box helicase domain-containing protein